MSLRDEMKRVAEIKVLDELYEGLGVTGLGWDGPQDAMETRIVLLEASRKPMSINMVDTLRSRGMSLFEKMWEQVRDFVCYLYRERPKFEGQELDLAQYIAAALIAAGKLANPIVAFVAMIAVRRGLDNLCALDK